MTDPRRLTDEGDAIERRLLESTVLDQPSDERRAAVLAGLGLAATVTTAASAAPLTTAAAKGLAGLATWKIVVGIAGVVAIGIGLSTTFRARAPEVAVAAPPITRSALPLPKLTVEPSAPVVAPSVAPAAAAPIVKSIPTPNAAPTLAQEMAFLDAARAKISSGDGTGAITALDRYDAECKGGALAIEAQVLRIEAIALCGDKSRAGKLASAFIGSHPSSSYLPRVRKHVIE